MELHSIDNEQRVYLLHSGNGRCCLYFDYAFERAEQVAKWCGCQMPNRENIGTEAGYAEYTAIMQNGSEYAKRTKTRCEIDLTPQLVGLEGKRVEVIDNQDNKRRFWVGKSTDWIPYHVEIFRVNALGGTAVHGTPFKSVTVVRTK